MKTLLFIPALFLSLISIQSYAGTIVCRNGTTSSWLKIEEVGKTRQISWNIDGIVEGPYTYTGPGYAIHESTGNRRYVGTFSSSMYGNGGTLRTPPLTYGTNFERRHEFNSCR